jgi:hypothetical protein
VKQSDTAKEEFAAVTMAEDLPETVYWNACTKSAYCQVGKKCSITSSQRTQYA